MTQNPLRKAAFLAAAAIVGAAVAAAATAAHHQSHSVTVGVISTQSGSGSATVGATIGTSSSQSGNTTGGSNTGSSSSGDDSSPPQPSYPVLDSNDALLQDSTPYGPGSFWYSDGTGQECAYVPDSSPLCYTVISDQPAVAVNPADLASSLAAELSLQAGTIAATPARGVTGAASWFWLDPAPTHQQLTETLDGETVTVDASPTVSWQFGDGATASGSPGVPYQPGTPPTDAVTHIYETRCLPGDQGNDPYVVASCGPGGYSVTAAIDWAISYSAQGPVTENGTLQDQTTDATISYPVTEIRGFLTGGQG